MLQLLRLQQLEREPRIEVVGVIDRLREPSLERQDGKVVVDDAGNISRSTRDMMFAPLSLSSKETP